MKNIIFFTMLISIIPVYSACSLDDLDATSCSIAAFQKQQPLATTYSQQSSIKEFSDTPETRLKPIQNDAPSRNLRDFGPQPADYSYNTSCQFGVCNPTGTPQLFEKRGQ